MTDAETIRAGVRLVHGYWEDERAKAEMLEALRRLEDKAARWDQLSTDSTGTSALDILISPNLHSNLMQNLARSVAQKLRGSGALSPMVAGMSARTIIPCIDIWVDAKLPDVPGAEDLVCVSDTPVLVTFWVSKSGRPTRCKFRLHADDPGFEGIVSEMWAPITAKFLMTGGAKIEPQVMNLDGCDDITVHEVRIAGLV